MVFFTFLSLLISSTFADDCAKKSTEVFIQIMLEDAPEKIIGKTQGTLLLDQKKKVLKIKDQEYPLYHLSMIESTYDSSISVNTRVQLAPEILIRILTNTLSKKFLHNKAVTYNINELQSYSRYFPRNPFVDLSSNYFASSDYIEDDTEDVFYPAKPHGKFEQPYMAVKFNFSKFISCKDPYPSPRHNHRITW
jgi:hypothetical protein